MCGRFTVATDPAELAERFEVELPRGLDAELQRRADAGRARRSCAGATQQRQLRELRFGLVPHWAKDLKVGFSMINARAETVRAKGAYRGLLERRRALIVADGFYEWRTDPDGTQAAGPLHPRGRRAVRVRRPVGELARPRGGCVARLVHDHHDDRQRPRRGRARPHAGDPAPGVRGGLARSRARRRRRSTRCSSPYPAERDARGRGVDARQLGDATTGPSCSTRWPERPTPRSRGSAGRTSRGRAARAAPCPSRRSSTRSPTRSRRRSRPSASSFSSTAPSRPCERRVDGHAERDGLAVHACRRPRRRGRRRRRGSARRPRARARSATAARARRSRRRLLARAREHDGVHAGVVAEAIDDRGEEVVAARVVERELGRRADDRDEARAVRAERWRARAGSGSRSER